MNQTQKFSKSDQLKIIYGEETANKIQTSNLLVVGAGGIGCELVKSLSLSGFTRISIIDLDTIDISNLNRQFLFRREHVDQPKSFTLKKQIEKQNPNIQIEAYLGKIQEDRFGYQFIKHFDLVVNALDNEEARKYVNQMCFNLGKPLVDAGTNGYDMTCISIMKGQTPCYQCVDRMRDQTFPVCTIRQKPEKLIHCIVWAKALFEGIYGPKEAVTQNIIEDIVEDLEKARENSAKSGNHLEFAQILIDKVFGDEAENLKKTLGERIKMPDCDKDEKASTEAFISLIKPHFFKDFAPSMEVDSSKEQKPEVSNQEAQTKVNDLNQQVQNFISSISVLHSTRKDEIGSLMFNKDDHLLVEFVTAATNIRANNFSIPMESLFKIKEMAGKIVPAISSSNALGASLQVLECIKLLQQKYDALKGIVYKRTDDKLRLNSFARTTDLPNPECQVCSDDSQSIVLLQLKHLDQFTLGNFKNDILLGQQEVGMTGQTIIVEYNSNIIYEYDQEMIDANDEDDVDEIKMNENRLKKCFKDLKIAHQSMILVQGATKDSPDSSIQYLIIEDQESAVPVKVDIIKKGIPSKKPPPKKVQEEEKNESLVGGKAKNDDHVDISSDELEEVQTAAMAQPDTRDAIMEDHEQKIPKKRSSLQQDEAHAPNSNPTSQKDNKTEANSNDGQVQSKRQKV